MLLSDAKAVYVGGVAAEAVYAGSVKVWPYFNPLDISGLYLWFDASQLGLANSAPVSPWPNLGAGPDGEIVGSPAPKLLLDAKNGLPVVQFTVSEGRVRLSGGSFALEWTVVYVARLRGPNPGRIVTATYPPCNLLVGWWNGYQDVMYDNGFAAPDMRQTWTTNWKLYAGDGTSGLSRLFSNGVLLSSTTTAGGWNGTFNISGFDPATAAETCDCDIAEILLYDRKLPDVDRQAVEAYLREKWGF